MYQIYMDGTLLPVTPSKFELKVQNQNKTATLIDGSEINMLKLPGLSEYSFDMLLPAGIYPFAQYIGGFKDQIFFLDKLELLKTSRKPFRLKVIRDNFDTDVLVSLEEYTIGEDAGEGKDITVKINLKKYNEYRTKRYVAAVQNNAGAPASVEEIVQRPSEKVIEKQYTVAKGDTLWAIAKKELGDGSRYTEIAKQNSISNPNELAVGQVIKLG